MRKDINQTPSWRTGDINLAAALMSQGVPLDPACPVSMVMAHEGDYSSFRLTMHHLPDGFNTEKLMDVWSGIGQIPDDHGFSIVCRFIKARPRGVQNTPDLMDFVVDYLRGLGHELPGLKTTADIPKFVEALPESDPAHILAYIHNREVCYKLHRTAAHRKSYHTEGTGDDQRRAILDTQLPKWQAHELLSRLQG